MAKLDWIPKDGERNVTFLVRHPKYHCPIRPKCIPGSAEDKTLVTNVLALATVSGRVTFADGRPASGIRIQGEGRGASNQYFRGHTSTQEDGTYSLDIYPDQSTILAVTDDQFGAESITSIRLTEGKKRNGQDFVLGGGTVIHGIATVGNEARPTAGQNATLIQKADGSSLVRWSTTDRDGRYHFIVGPGVYELTLPNAEETLTVTVDNQGEIVHDTHADRLARGAFSGKIVDEQGNPVGDTLVLGESDVRGHAGFKSNGDEEGQFVTERWNDDMVVYAYQNAARKAGFAEVSATDQEVSLAIRDAASVVGMVVDEKGKPQANLRMQILLKLPNLDRGISFFSLTDEKGQFEFPAVAVGTRCTIYASTAPVAVKAPEIKIEAAKEYKLDVPLVVKVAGTLRVP